MKNNDDKNNRKTALLNMLIAALWCVFTIMIVTLFFAERYLMDNWSALSIEEIAFHAVRDAQK